MTSRPYSKSRAAPSRWASVRPVGAGPDGLTNHPSACRLEATDPIKKPRNLFATVLHEGHVQVLMRSLITVPAGKENSLVPALRVPGANQSVIS